MIIKNKIKEDFTLKGPSKEKMEPSKRKLEKEMNREYSWEKFHRIRNMINGDDMNAHIAVEIIDMLKIFYGDEWVIGEWNENHIVLNILDKKGIVIDQKEFSWQELYSMLISNDIITEAFTLKGPSDEVYKPEKERFEKITGEKVSIEKFKKIFNYIRSMEGKLELYDWVHNRYSQILNARINAFNFSDGFGEAYTPEGKLHAFDWQWAYKMGAWPSLRNLKEGFTLKGPDKEFIKKKKEKVEKAVGEKLTDKQFAEISSDVQATGVESMLARSIKHNEPLLVKLSLAFGADPNTFYYSHVLTIAIKYERVEIAKILLEAGADPNLRDGWPLEMCVRTVSEENKDKMVDVLLNYGARANDKTIWHVLQKEDFGLFKKMVESGSRITRLHLRYIQINYSEEQYNWAKKKFDLYYED